MTQPLSGRDYRAHAQKVKEKEPTEIVTLKSGSVFELRRPDLMGYVSTGRLPQSLLTEALAAWKTRGIVSAESIAAKLDDQKAVDSLILMREIVHDACVNPKFVEIATADDEIGAADMLPADFTEIFEWAMTHQGVAGLEGLKSFRSRRKRRASSSGNRQSKQRVQAEQLVEA
jgi:hypothetical protein